MKSGSFSDPFISAPGSIQVTTSNLAVSPYTTTPHITGFPVAAVNPRTVKWLTFTATVTLVAVPLSTIFFSPPLTPPPCSGVAANLLYR
jgi:hypothetical protein